MCPMPWAAAGKTGNAGQRPAAEASMDARTNSNMGMLQGIGQDFGPVDGRIDLAALVASRPDSAVAALLAAADLVLVVSSDGRIEQAQAGSGALTAADIAGWPGRMLADTLAPAGAPADWLAELLAAPTAPRWREAIHGTAAAALPLQWLALPLPGGRRLAIARDLRAAARLQQRLARAQQALQRDAMRLRQLEQRHRLLFDTAAEPIFVLDAASRRILEANGAAIAATGQPATVLIGASFAALLDDADHDAAVALLGALAAGPQRQPLPVRLAGGSPYAIITSLFRQDQAARVLVRLATAQPALAAHAGARAAGLDSLLQLAIERLPDPLVLTNDRLVILAGNGAFLDLVGLARPADIEGLPLARFLGRPGADLAPMVAALRKHGLVHGFATIADGQAVEVSALSSGKAEARRHGFSIRPARPAQCSAHDSAPHGNQHAAQPAESGGGAAPAAIPVAELAGLVGRMPLKDIVRDAIDLIERLCIKTALDHAADNRASAAGLLGLSRQSLYTKLHRHGLGNFGAGLPDNGPAGDGSC